MPFELVPAGTHIDFIGKRRICAVVSIVLLLGSLGAALTRGVKLGIDFAGGTEVQLRFADLAVDEGSVRSVLEKCGIEEASVVRFGASDEFLIKFGAPSLELFDTARSRAFCPLDDRDQAALDEALAHAQGADATGLIVALISRAMANEVGAAEVLRVEFVGPRVGHELRRDGMNSLLIACLLILIYVAFRFTARFAPGAVIALIHDIGITAGIFVMFGLEFDLKVLAALLAILGYSLNDTIIIYDRIRENMELRTKFDLTHVLNHSVNQTLSRTVLTSGSTMAAVLALLFLGGEVLRPFALALSIGIVVGTYSSIFIAAPTLLWLEQRLGNAPSGPSDAGEPPAKVKRQPTPLPRAGQKPRGKPRRKGKRARG